jgi:hypothetical protein
MLSRARLPRDLGEQRSRHETVDRRGGVGRLPRHRRGGHPEPVGRDERQPLTFGPPPDTGEHRQGGLTRRRTGDRDRRRPEQRPGHRADRRRRACRPRVDRGVELRQREPATRHAQRQATVLIGSFGRCTDSLPLW